MRTKKFIVALCFSFFMFMCSVSTVYAYNTYNQHKLTYGVGNYGKGVKQAADTVRKVGVQDVTMKLYPGGRHEILNDREHGEVYEDVLSFYEEILAKTI
jgi:hypothetical protein